MTNHNPLYDLQPKAIALLARVKRDGGPMLHQHLPLLMYVLQQAQTARTDAGYGGSHHDGGAGDLERQVEVFVAALLGETPESWEKFAKALRRNNDPDYQKYLELKRRFE